MASYDETDMAESWIEVSPQSLGYQPTNTYQNRFLYVAEQSSQMPRTVESGGFHTVLEQQLLTRLLSEAQDHSDRASEASPPTPPPSRQGISGLGPTNASKPESLTSFSSAAATGFLPLTTVPGEWSSRPEIGAYFPVVDEVENGCSSSSELSPNQSPALPKTWSIRSSAFMKSRIIGWLLDHIPTLLSHTATFLLGAATMFFLLRKRIDWTKIMRLPLD